MVQSFTFSFYTVLFVKICFALPPTSRDAPISHNLHQNLSPHDINAFGKDPRVKALLDVKTTIDEVQKLISADPSLPRLTK